MGPSITNWYTAGGRLAKIQDVCEAFVDGDQPDKIEHLALEDIQAFFDELCAIVTFGASALESGVSHIEFRHYEIYNYAKRYSRTMAKVLLHHDDIEAEYRKRLEEWLDILPSLPQVNVQYV